MAFSLSSLFPDLPDILSEESDIVLTPRDVARDVVSRFQPCGRVLDPCKGDGAFTEFMPEAEWCEIREGRDFFDWREPVDWIVSNPPYSIFSRFLRHSMKVAQDIVYVVPTNKVFNSDGMMRELWAWGGIPQIYQIAPGRRIGFPVGYGIGAVHFQRGYRGPIQVTFRDAT